MLHPPGRLDWIDWTPQTDNPPFAARLSVGPGIA